MQNLIQQFLNQFDNKDDPILITRQELEEFILEVLAEYEKNKHQKKVKQYPKSI